MNELDLSVYVGRKEKESLSHKIWNGVFGAIQTKVNEIIAALSDSSGDDESSASGVVQTYVTLTQEEYDALEEKAPMTTYLIVGEPVWCFGDALPIVLE